MASPHPALLLQVPQGGLREILLAKSHDVSSPTMWDRAHSKMGADQSRGGKTVQRGPGRDHSPHPQGQAGGALPGQDCGGRECRFLGKDVWSLIPGGRGGEGDECVSTGPGWWQVLARGGLSHRPGLVLALSAPPKVCCRLSLHGTATRERLAQVPARGWWGRRSEREVTGWE